MESSIVTLPLVVFFPDEEQKEEPEEEEEALTGKDEEEQRIAEMGRPTLGDHVKLEVIIEESYEFKVRLRTLYESFHNVCNDACLHISPGQLEAITDFILLM